MFIHVITPARAIAGVHFKGEVHLSERDPDSFKNALKGDMLNPLKNQEVVSLHISGVSVHDDNDVENLNHIVKGFLHFNYWVCWCE